MSSYLTFDGLKRRPIAGFEPDEFQYMAVALVQRVKEGSMPPDDAYWWTRALCAEPFMRSFPDFDDVLADQSHDARQCRVA